MPRRPPHYLPEPVARQLRRLLRAGATRDAAAEAVGISRSQLDQRLRDQLRDVRVGQGRRERQRSVPDPTADQIAARAAAIRERWSDTQWRDRTLYFNGPAD